MKIELHLSDSRPDKVEAEDAARSVDGLEILTLSLCPEHKLGIILVQAPDQPLDMACAVQTCLELIRMLDQYNRELMHKRAARN